MSAKTYRYFDIILGLFIAVLLISNIAPSAKIIDLGFGIFKIPMAFNAGSLLFPIGYVFGDIPGGMSAGGIVFGRLYQPPLV